MVAKKCSYLNVVSMSSFVFEGILIYPCEGTHCYTTGQFGQTGLDKLSNYS